MGNLRPISIGLRSAARYRCEAVHLTGRAIALYMGHFLEGESEYPWIFSPRERLRAKYLRGVEALVSYWENAGEFEMAIKCSEKALDVDDLAEEIYHTPHHLLPKARLAGEGLCGLRPLPLSV